MRFLKKISSFTYQTLSFAVKPIILPLEEVYGIVRADDTRIDSVVILTGEVARREVGRDKRGKSLVSSRGEKIIKAGDGKLIDELCSEVVYDKQIALEVLIRHGLVRAAVSAFKFIVLKGGDDVLRAVVQHVVAALDKNLCDRGGDVRFSRTRLADKQQIVTSVLLAVVIGKVLCASKHILHFCVNLGIVRVCREVEVLKRLLLDKLTHTRRFYIFKIEELSEAGASLGVLKEA